MLLKLVFTSTWDYRQSVFLMKFSRDYEARNLDKAQVNTRLKRKDGVFKFLSFGERFRKTPFSWRVSVDGRPNRRNKATFSWRVSMDGRPNRRKKAPFSWRISVHGKLNRTEIKLRFRDGLGWTVGPTVEIKLRFRDGLVWTVGLTVEIKLRFQS